MYVCMFDGKTRENFVSFAVGMILRYLRFFKCSLTGHLELSFSRNDGPSNRIEFFKSFTSDPLDTMSAGSCSVGT